MAHLRTKFETSIASMMIQQLDPRTSLIDKFKDDVLTLLPRGTQLVGLQEIVSFNALSRTFELTFDCPYFQKDFEFVVEFNRNVLSDGTINHMYCMATKIINLDEQKERFKNG